MKDGIIGHTKAVFFQTMRNTSISDQVYEFGHTYVGFGFVDLFQLMWGIHFNDRDATLTFHGFDMNRVTTLRSKLIYGAMRNLQSVHAVSYKFGSHHVGTRKP